MKDTISGHQIKLGDRRVFLGRLDDGSYAILFTILDKDAPKSERIKQTPLVLAEKTMDALVQLYNEETL